MFAMFTVYNVDMVERADISTEKPMHLYESPSRSNAFTGKEATLLNKQN